MDKAEDERFMRLALKEAEIAFDLDEVPVGATKYFIQNSSKNDIDLKILNLRFKKKNFYGGPAARSKQIEVIGELEYSFQDVISSKNGTLLTSGWVPVTVSTCS